ncbi:MAG: hypothetical protein KA207_02805 [Burkholderiaceae bacterium]|nr:hypothetical protein [Burkholderiaceae bacterium]
MKHGHHIGDLPWDFDLERMGELHARGYDTISSSTYQVLIAEGIDPKVFRTWGPSQICQALDEASLV